LANQLQTEITMGSQLGEIAAVIERLRSDPELRSRIYGREAAFLIAMREALANAVTHGNHHDASRKVYVQYICEPDGSVSILIRDEGDGFDPSDVPIPNDMGEDSRRGIHLMTSCMDEVQFRRNGTEVYMRMTKHQDPRPEEDSQIGDSGRKGMLRITVKEKHSEQRWTLQGRLTKECVAELISNWRAARSRPSAANRVVDLNEITVIDKSGEEVLSMMIGEGVKFMATGLYTKHLLEALHTQTGNPSIPD
jgi:anti-sigma regulatory factor (Ser/Thr protein kinase)